MKTVTVNTMAFGSVQERLSNVLMMNFVQEADLIIVHVQMAMVIVLDIKIETVLTLIALAQIITSGIKILLK